MICPVNRKRMGHDIEVGGHDIENGGQITMSCPMLSVFMGQITVSCPLATRGRHLVASARRSSGVSTRGAARGAPVVASKNGDGPRAKSHHAPIVRANRK